MNAARPAPLARLLGVRSYGRPRRGIFTPELATIGLPPESISSARLQPEVSISVALAALSDRGDGKIMTAGRTFDASY